MPPKNAAVKKTSITDYFGVPKKNGKKKMQEEEEQKQNEEVQIVTSGGIKMRVDPHDFPDFEEFCDGLLTWKPLLKNYISNKAFKDTYQYVKSQYATQKCYPPSHLIFNAFSTTHLQKLKVIVVGQDPYHQPGQAMGLCFSVPKSCKFPPSLNNIYKGMQADPKMPKFSKPNHGDLTKWAEQGVFLLNDILTVQDSTPNAHKAANWGKFTDEVIRLINTELSNCVFLLWGKPAQKKAAVVNTNRHLVLKTSHPSPLGAHAGFLTSKQFSECNEYLVKHGKEPIDWNWN
ncbi:Uracil-DNA glycosylase-like protein [Pseudocohnilembus persalinus]|uniref:Uracil-DNA glycosylase n=1 Tax=Pseudocohnilembus persalinus TaxID=266149 RepID=A0A0V0QW49_PSEPJ|nr:Uracil-DNA glycosylase-like protein [Pseudocohnilembus persalinus]|eukprot:KRX06317.1 Uracil-DNA glycosylase-like protein [Pseudocohnilembus persalinus]